MRKIIGSGLALIVGGYYMIANQFVEDTVVGQFTHDGKEYVLFLTDHPDGTVFVSLWNYDEGDFHASTDWFRRSDSLSFDCQSVSECKIFRAVNEEKNTISGWELKVSALQSPLTNYQYESENVHGFKPFTVQYSDVAALNVEVPSPTSTISKTQEPKASEEKVQLRSGEGA